MLHILMGILKVIGIILLIILTLIIVVLLGVLFVPVRYKGYVKKDKDIIVKINVFWLLHTIDGKYFFPENEFEIKIFGITIEQYKIFWGKIKSILLKLKTKKEKNSKEKLHPTEKKQSTRPTAKKEAVQEKSNEKATLETVDIDKTNDRSADEEYNFLNKESNNQIEKEITTKIEDNKKIESKKEKETTEKEIIHKDKDTDRGKTSLVKRICGIIKRIIDFIKNIPSKVKNIWRMFKERKDEFDSKIKDIKQFINDEGNRAAFVFLKNEIIKLLLYIKPTKLKGWVRFGFDDPATTGQVLGICGMLMPIFKDNISITPNFEGTELVGEITFKGRIRIIRLIVLAVKVLRNDDVMTIYRRFSK